MLKKIFILALVSLCTAAVCGEKYSVLVFGDTHYDSQDVRVETKLTRNKKLELARNLEIWKTNMPLLIKAFNMLNVSDEGVFCDLYTGDMKAPFKTIKLR